MEVIMDLRQIKWDEKLWGRFVRRVKKKISLADSREMGVLCIKSLGNRTSFENQVLVKGYLSEYLDKYRPLDMNISDVGERQIKLPLSSEVDSNTYLFYCSRQAILKTNVYAAEKILQHFLNLRLYYNKDYINFLFFEEDMENMLILQDETYGEINGKGNILDFVRRQLCGGAYVNIHLDEFYLGGKDYYKERHYVHESLIYGFDDENQVFLAYGIAARQRTGKFTITYWELLMAYEKGKLFYFCGASYLEWEGYYPVTVIQIREIPSYTFSEGAFADKIFAFLNPPENEGVEGDIHAYGKNVYEWILQDLTGEQARNIVDYRLIHLLYEHKCCIRNRLECLQKRRELSEEGRKLYIEMKTVEEKFQRIRLFYLKQLKKEGKLYLINKVVENQEVKRWLAEQIEEAAEKEEYILRNYCDRWQV